MTIPMLLTDLSGHLRKDKVSGWNGANLSYIKIYFEGGLMTDSIILIA